MKILIGIDDSAFSKAALDYVKSMRWPTGTKFVVLSAARAPMVAYATVDARGMTGMNTAEQEIIQQAEELASQVEHELQGAGLATEARVVQGDPREVLVEAARSTGADLVVVGSHGRTGFNKLLLGSVASHVVTHAPCSVMVVKSRKS
jgi:nucleotide-binding universal stress UspA family protein